MNWEYKIVELRPKAFSFEDWMNELGGEGWELVTAFLNEKPKIMFLFKRPVPQILVSEEFTTWTDESRLDNVSDP